ncbi:unnamed protein product [Echinostoma caproni]|uniref:Group XV phospholipase A2 n=1 Tax=Echinostoma caproni TaxID=27848 RepID=A0A183AYH7_9TREM|nr:unnamed protein product [Echinostoma caproni]
MMRSFTMLWILLFWFCTCRLIRANPIRGIEQHPIILIPGDGGSQAYCHKSNQPESKSTLIWVNLWYLVVRPSVMDQMKLVYDPKTGNTSDIGPCQIRFPGWGETWSIENLDTWKHSFTAYYQYLVAALRKDPFYVSGKTLRGAPYDFRRTPYENTDFVPNLKELVEETYANAGDRRIVLIGHSFGSVYGLHFLQAMNDSWKRRFIQSYVSISGPLGGSVKAILLEAYGEFAKPLR